MKGQSWQRKLTKRETFDNWRTPPEVWDPLNAEFKFDADAACDKSNCLVGRPFDAMGKSWKGKRVFCNPPYGRHLEPFVRRCALEGQRRVVVALIPMRSRAAYWHESVIAKADEIRFVRKRVRFMRPDGSRGEYVGSCDSVIVVWKPGSHRRKISSFLQSSINQAIAKKPKRKK